MLLIQALYVKKQAGILFLKKKEAPGQHFIQKKNRAGIKNSFSIEQEKRDPHPIMAAEHAQGLMLVILAIDEVQAIDVRVHAQGLVPSEDKCHQ